MKQTVLTELIRKWEFETDNYRPSIPIYTAFINDAKSVLQLEKEQIANAYECGAYDFQGKKIEVTNGDGIDYYNENYTKNISQRELHIQKEKDVYSRFNKGFLDKLKDVPIVHNTIQALIHGHDPYTIIENLLTIHNSTSNELSKIREMIYLKTPFTIPKEPGQ